jgi:hypothetical protein
MKRTVLTVSLLLLAGAIATFAVQCLAVLVPGPVVHETVSRSEDRTLAWPGPMPAGYAPDPVDRQSFLHWGSSRIGWAGPWQGDGITGSCRSFMVSTCGWPFRSAVARTFMRDPQSEHFSTGIMVPTTNWPPWLKRGVPPLTVLPVQPIWRGLLANTVLYAAVIGALTLGPSHLRRRRRRARGLCIRCGYQLAPAVPRCPECGNGQPAARGV